MSAEKKRIVKRSKTNSVMELVASRLGVTPQELEREVSGKCKNVLNIAGLDKAVDLFWSMIDSPVYVYCDYDCDGITSGSIISIGCNSIGIKPHIIIPRRFTDGYGIKVKNLENMDPSGLLITVDNGIAANEAVDTAKEKGMKVIILDHHEARILNGEQFLPEADVVIDPHITEADFEDYCGAGLAYRFMREVFAKKRRPADLNGIMSSMIALAAVGTVGDSVTMKAENRFLVRRGMEQIEQKRVSTGLALLLEEMKLSDTLSVEDIAYSLVPAINAFGRLEDEGSRKVAALLSYTGRKSDGAKNAAQIVKQMNDERKTYCKELTELAEKMVEETGQMNNSVLVLQDNRFLKGICGIIAGNLTEKYKVPSIVFGAPENGICVGSGRSRDWCNLKAVMVKCSGLFFEYGGHPAACGASIQIENIDTLRQMMCDLVEKVEEPGDDVVFYDIDGNVHTLYALYKDVRKYGPYGVGNEEPVVCLKGLELKENKFGDLFREMGSEKQHLKLFCEGIDVLWFNASEKYKEMGKPKKLNVVGRLSTNTYKGKTSLQINAEYVEAAE